MDQSLLEDIANSLPPTFVAECPALIRRCQAEAHESAFNNPKFSGKAARRHFPYERINTIDSEVDRLAKRCGLETTWRATASNENCWHYLEIQCSGWVLTISHVAKDAEVPDKSTHRAINAKLNSVMDGYFDFMQEERPDTFNGIITYRTSYTSDVELDWVRFTVPTPEAKSGFTYCDFTEIRASQRHDEATPEALPIKLRTNQADVAE